jgi:hypothetical protein
MAGLPDAAFTGLRREPIYDTAASAASTLEPILTTMNVDTKDFRKALDGVIGARSREATRRICRPYEYQLIGAFTKRPN